MIGDHAFGPCVVVPARVARVLARHFKIEQFRVDVRGTDRELDSVLSSWCEVAACENRRLLGSVPGTRVDSDVPGAGSSSVMNTRAVAGLSGVSDRGVRAAVDRGALLALPREGHALLFCADDVATWMETRER